MGDLNNPKPQHMIKSYQVQWRLNTGKWAYLSRISALCCRILTKPVVSGTMVQSTLHLFKLVEMFLWSARWFFFFQPDLSQNPVIPEKEIPKGKRHLHAYLQEVNYEWRSTDTEEEAIFCIKQDFKAQKLYSRMKMGKQWKAMKLKSIEPDFLNGRKMAEVKAN